MSALIVHCSCPDAASAERIARVLVEERLAACVQALSRIRSTYRWQGEVCSGEEFLLLIKTTRVRLEAVKSRLADLHPYEVPELLVLDVVDGSAAYLDWLAEATAPS
ncbi:divalent-cation tolerance protein CutA [Dokdonella sp.]|uniref:divalent-cation tolerance protein CutA n=1 Tax=Dokdonella sp. TaxID=2291710 RepID=UPI0031C56121|nr:divalent-cation tolerance protein CutA [Dokdonella sp.]